MNTLILFYSLGGATKKEAELIALENPGSVLIEIKEMRRETLSPHLFPGLYKRQNEKPLKYSRLKPKQVCSTDLLSDVRFGQVTRRPPGIQL